MSVEILGMITATPSSEVDQPLGEAVDAGFVRRFAQAHEDAGFDRVLVGYFSNAAEGAVVSSFVAAATRRLGVLLAYRPGVIAAPLAARQLATLDQFSEGRLALNVVSGGNDEDLARDGDYLDHDRRYARTDEYLQALRAIWTATGPVDFDGEFYRFQGASPAVRPRQSPHIPIYFSGSSDAAIEVAARHADTYMLSGRAAGRGRRAYPQSARRRQGPGTRSALLGVIPADRRGYRGGRLEACRRGARTGPREPCAPRSAAARPPAAECRFAAPAGRRRAGRGARQPFVDRRGPADRGALELHRPGRHPQQVAAALGEYYRLGVSTFLIRGFDPLGDAVRYGQGLIPAIHDHIARLPLLRHAG